jgi:hypothetical protein
MGHTEEAAGNRSEDGSVNESEHILDTQLDGGMVESEHILDSQLTGNGCRWWRP